METSKTLLFAKNISEVLYQIKNNPGLRIIGGFTLLKELPEKTLCIKNIDELKTINHHERYIDFGPAVTLNDILEVREERIPRVMNRAALNTANHFIRNMATLGGNICTTETRGTMYAPLLALNASLRFRNTENQIVSSMALEKFTDIPSKNLLVNIRVPNEDWDVSIFRRCGPRNIFNNDSASFCFLARTEKTSLISVRMAFAGPIVFSSQELENKLLGIRLPISEEIIKDFSDAAAEGFDKAAGKTKYNPILRQQFLNLTQSALNQLT